MPVQVPTEVHFLLIRPVLPLCCPVLRSESPRTAHRGSSLLRSPRPLCALPVLPCLCCPACAALPLGTAHRGSFPCVCCVLALCCCACLCVPCCLACPCVALRLCCAKVLTEVHCLYACFYVPYMPVPVPVPVPVPACVPMCSHLHLCAYVCVLQMAHRGSFAFVCPTHSTFSFSVCAH
jgi:hypothetical protein